MRGHRTWLLGLLIVYLAAAFQTHSIQTTYMREDEEIAYRSTQYDLGYAVQFQAYHDVQAPLWFASFWLWQQFMGDSEFMGRVYSIFLSAVTMAMVYQIGKRWFGAPRYGLFAMAALGVSAFFFLYSLEIRPYAMVMLAATLSMWLFERWLEKRTWKRAAFYGLSLTLMLYTHYFLFFLILVQGIYFLWHIIRAGTASRAPSPVHARRVLDVQGVGAGALALVVWLPWLPVIIGQIQTLRRIEGAAQRGIGIANTTEATTVEAALKLLNAITNGQVVLYLLALGVGIVYLRRSGHYWLALLWGVGVPALALVINLAASVYTQRYVTYLSVGLALAAGAGLAAIWNRQDATNAKIMRGGALAGFVALNLWGLPAQLPTDRIPYRDLLRDLSRAARTGDVIFFDHADISDNFAQWQFRHYLTPALQENSYSSMAAVADARRIWHITAHWFDNAVRANFAAIEQTHPRQTGFGQCDLDWCYLIQLMEAPPQTSPTVFGEDMAFWGLDVDEITSSVISARLWWKVERTPDVNYSISLQLLDSGGALVAQADGPINHYAAEIVETSQLEPGRIYMDRRSLALPAGVAAGDYRLALVVYQSWDGVRLTLADGSDSLMLDSVHIS